MKKSNFVKRRYLAQRPLVAYGLVSSLGKRASLDSKENIDNNVMLPSKKLHIEENHSDSSNLKNFFEFIKPFSSERRKCSSFTNNKSEFEVIQII